MTNKLIENIKGELDFPLATHQAFIDSMYALLDRIELKACQIREYTEILEMKWDAKQRQSNEYNYYNKRNNLVDEFEENFKCIYTNFGLLKTSTQDLVFK